MYDVELNEIAVSRYFTWINERESIRIMREQGSSWPWTADPILKKYRFTNVYREDDTVTKLIRENIRERLNTEFLKSGENSTAAQDLIWSIIAARWFNRPETIEQLIESKFLSLETWDPDKAENWLRGWRPKGPWVTGSFIIRGRPGGDKLEGVLWCIHQAHKQIESLTLDLLHPNITLQQATKELCRLHFMAGFLAYEVVCDLQYTGILDHCSDRYTWANNTGPGARRGAARIMGSKLPKPGASEEDTLKVMETLMNFVYISGRTYTQENLPLDVLNPIFIGRDKFTMREIENGLCEFDKYERTRLGQGKPRNNFKNRG